MLPSLATMMTPKAWVVRRRWPSWRRSRTRLPRLALLKLTAPATTMLRFSAAAPLIIRPLPSTSLTLIRTRPTSGNTLATTGSSPTRSNGSKRPPTACATPTTSTATGTWTLPLFTFHSQNTPTTTRLGLASGAKGSRRPSTTLASVMLLSTRASSWSAQDSM